MITYKYNLLVDLRTIYDTFKHLKWLKSKKIKIIYPNIFRMIKLLIKLPKDLPKIDVKEGIICYFVSCGTWGAYQLPNKIFICPYQIPDMKGTIEHEILHLRHEADVKDMTHEKKEEYIDSKEL